MWDVFSGPVIRAEMHFVSVFTKLCMDLSATLVQVLLGDLEIWMLTFDKNNGMELLIGQPLGL